MRNKRILEYQFFQSIWCFIYIFLFYRAILEWFILVVVATSQSVVFFYSEFLNVGKRHCATVLFIYLLQLVKTKVDDEGVAIVRSIEKRSGGCKNQDGDVVVEEKKIENKITYIHPMCWVCVLIVWYYYYLLQSMFG